MKLILLSIGGMVFLVSVFAHIYVKIKLRPPADSNLDDIYWEFEDSCPELARYNRLCEITFIAAMVGLLFLFLAVVF